MLAFLASFYLNSYRAASSGLAPGRGGKIEYSLSEVAPASSASSANPVALPEPIFYVSSTANPFESTRCFI